MDSESCPSEGFSGTWDEGDEQDEEGEGDEGEWKEDKDYAMESENESEEASRDVPHVPQNRKSAPKAVKAQVLTLFVLSFPHVLLILPSCFHC